MMARLTNAIKYFWPLVREISFRKNIISIKIRENGIVAAFSFEPIAKNMLAITQIKENSLFLNEVDFLSFK